jgi:predicted HicB family RNase H-like nuclease
MPEITKWGKRPTNKPANIAASMDEFVTGKSEKPARLNFVIPTELHKRVKAACASQGVSMTDVVVEFLETRFPKN